MSQPQFPMAQFEDGMLERIRHANKAVVEDAPLLGYVFRDISNYQGQLEQGPDFLAQRVNDFPAMWACYETASYVEESGLWMGTYSVVCVARNARNEQAARRGAGAGEIGVYQLARDVAALIDGHHCGVDGCTAVRCTKIDVPFNMAFGKTRAAIALLTFVVYWDPNQVGGPTGAAPSEGALPEGNFATFDVGWDIPPFSDPELAPPSSTGGAFAGDAEDTIALPQTGD